MLNGIDIASHQSGLDLTKISYDFVIIKATGGTGYKNPKFKYHMEQALAQNKLVGAYHFALDGYPNTSPEKEASFFLKTAEPYLGKIALALDWEATAIKLGSGWAKRWLDYVYEQTGIRPLIYMSHGIGSNATWAEVAKNYPLWMAQYASYTPQKGYNSNPWGSKTCGKWGTDILIRQYTSSGYLNGWGSRLDFNLFYGDADDWKKLTQKSGSTEQPTEPTQPSTPEQPVTPTAKTYEQIAREVIQGKWGNGATRKKKLTEAGYNYDKVQEFVNAIVYNRVLPAEPDSKKLDQSTIHQVALEVIQGKWGNGATRRRRLSEAGYDPDTIQAEVNRIYR